MPSTVEAHQHRFRFAPLSVNLSELTFELAYAGPATVALLRRVRGGREEVVGHSAGLLSHVTFRPTRPLPLMTFSLHADCADCGTQLDFGPFHLKELHGYLADPACIVRETYPDEAE